MANGRIGEVSANVVNHVALAQESDEENVVLQTMEGKIASVHTWSLLLATWQVAQVRNYLVSSLLIFVNRYLMENQFISSERHIII